MSDFCENKILDHLFGGGTTPAVATNYLALFTVAPTDSTSGTEVTGGSYARKAVTANQTNFPAASAGSITNNVAQSFVTPTADWGTVVAAAIMDAATAGNILYWMDLTVAKALYDGDPVTFPIGSLVFTQT